MGKIKNAVSNGIYGTAGAVAAFITLFCLFSPT